MNYTKEQIRNRLLEKMEGAQVDSRFPKENILSLSFVDTKKLAVPPQTINRLETVTFRLPKATRILFTVLVPVISIVVLYKMRHLDLSGLIFFACIVLLVNFMLLFYYWFSDRFNDRLTINTTGIIFENYLYRWDHILTTHIKRVIKKDEEIQPQTFYYLVLGLDKDALIDINFTRFSVTGKILPKSNEELATFCWWIEHFKRNGDI